MAVIKYTLLFCAICAVIRCSSAPSSAGNTGGSSSEVVAMVLDGQGMPAAGAEVTLRRSDYLADTASGLPKARVSRKETVTEADGSFRIDSVDPGTYCVEVNDGRSAAVLLQTDVLEGIRSIELGILTLTPYAAVNGSVDTATLRGAKAFVQIYGMERLVAADSDGRFSFNDLPVGDYRLRIVSNDTAFRPVVTDTIRAISGETAPVLAGWRFSKCLYLNTTQSGAGVGEDISEFPLLVRLNSSTLTSASTFFSQAQDSGQDIRFSESDGTALPYELEFWNSGMMEAAVWVKIDTVKGNNSAQYIVMHWGNPDAVSGSDGAAVFDTADGFSGVWHFGANAFLRDATVNHNDANRAGGTASAGGIIADGWAFSGGCVNVPDDPSLRIPDELSISLWFKTDSAAQWNIWRYLISRGNGMANQSNYHILFYDSDTAVIAGGYQDGIDSNATQCTVNAIPYRDGNWHFVNLTRTGATVSLYLDGALSAQVNSAGPAIADSADLKIGADFTETASFPGSIDEVRICRKAPSADWEKLSYESQKSNSRLIVY